MFSNFMTQLAPYVPNAYALAAGAGITVITGARNPITTFALGIILVSYIQGGAAFSLASSVSAKGATLLASGQALLLGLPFAAHVLLASIVALAILRSIRRA